jgi:hypothetical protein
MQTLVIGDIHGCYVELQALLEKAGLSETDSILAVGDIVDRGPETPQVLNFFQQTPNVRTLMGNHERKHVRAARHEVKLSMSQVISREQLGPAYPAALDWMGALPLYIELPEAVLAHGYLEPGLPLDQQNPSVLCGTMGGDKILRERYDRPWYELYTGDKPVIVGHYNYSHSDRPFIHQDKIFGLDTDCVTGHVLTGLLLPSFQFVSVPSRGSLWAETRSAYRRAHPSQRSAPRLAIPWTEQDDLDLAKLINKIKITNDGLMARLQSMPVFSELTPRQQAKLYATHVSEAGTGKFATLMQLARLSKLDLETGRKILKEPKEVHKLLTGQIDETQSNPP